MGPGGTNEHRHRDRCEEPRLDPEDKRDAGDDLDGENGIGHKGGETNGAEKLCGIG